MSQIRAVGAERDIGRRKRRFLYGGTDGSNPVPSSSESGANVTSGFVMVERRNGRIYPMAPGGREGVAMTAEAVSALLDEAGCLTESEARCLLDQLGDRGDRLARTLR